MMNDPNFLPILIVFLMVGSFIFGIVVGMAWNTPENIQDEEDDQMDLGY